MKRKKYLELGNRERQLVETICHLGEVSVSEVLDSLDAKPKPAYSTIRTILNTLVRKKVLASRRDGVRFLYRSIASREQTQTHAMREIVDSLFGGSVSSAIVSLLDLSDNKMTDDDYNRLAKMIRDAKKDERS